MNKTNKLIKSILIILATLAFSLFHSLVLSSTIEDGVNALKQKEYEQAIKTLMKHKNNADGMYWIAEYYSGSYGNPKKAKESFKWMSNASQKGSVNAHERLAQFYENGFGTKQNSKLAFKHRKIAAENGNVESMGNLGYAYLYGEGTVANKQTGTEWLEKGIANNDLLSHQILGAELVIQNNTPEDLKRAETLLQKSWGIGGFYNSAYFLGVLYMNPNYEGKDNKRAFEFFKVAAEEGKDTDAMISLGLMYQDAIYVSRNYTTAKDYFQRARDLGYGKAEQYIAELNKVINENQRVKQEREQNLENDLNRRFKPGTEVCYTSRATTEEYAGHMFGRPHFKTISGNQLIRAYVERREGDKLQLRVSMITLTSDIGKIFQLDATNGTWGNLRPNSIFWSDYFEWGIC